MTDAPPSSSTPTTWTPEGEVPAAAPKISETALIDAVAQVFDPEIPVNVYELGLIYAFDIADDGHVKVEMTLTAPNCPSAQELPAQVKDVVSAVAGVTACDVQVVWDPPWDPSRMSEEARLQLNMF
jgi:FeS assembly SUF system protein